jgi:hypothetical protein
MRIELVTEVVTTKTLTLIAVAAPSFFLVMLIVTATPTANNIMIMTELAGMFQLVTQIESMLPTVTQSRVTEQRKALAACLPVTVKVTHGSKI